MGNRIIKESILWDQALNALPWFEQVLFTRLIVSADDYGIFHADPTILSRTVFPCHPAVTGETIRKSLKRLEDQGLILRYTAGGSTYLKLRSWEKHQRMRTSRHKFPVPEQADNPPGSPPPEETEPETAFPEKKAPGEPPPPGEPALAAEAKELPVFALTLIDNTQYAVTRESLDQYASLYPSLDIMQELHNMQGWLLGNPERRKTRKGIERFIHSWLKRDQTSNTQANKSAAANPFDSLSSEEPYTCSDKEGNVR